MSPSIPKPSSDDVARFRSLLEHRPELEIKPMFGNLAAFVIDNQQMCAGLFGPMIGLRLPEEERAELLSEPGAIPFGPRDRPMKEYATLPSTWGPEDAGVWIGRAIAHSRALPAKKKRKK